MLSSLRHGQRCVGTVLGLFFLKGFSKDLVISKSQANKKLKRGDSLVASTRTKHGDVHVVRWIDNKPVHFMSSSQSGEIGTGAVTRLDKRNGPKIPVACPDTVNEYQNTWEESTTLTTFVRRTQPNSKCVGNGTTISGGGSLSLHL